MKPICSVKSALPDYERAFPSSLRVNVSYQNKSGGNRMSFLKTGGTCFIGSHIAVEMINQDNDDVEAKLNLPLTQLPR